MPNFYSATASMYENGSTSLECAILAAIAYADIFDYPLTSAEVHRYLVGVGAPAAAVSTVLETSGWLRQHLQRCDGFYFLDGREEIVRVRRRRARIAANRWPLAIRYGRVIAHLPFVRMVTVTGALAVDNTERNTDIDYLVVTTPGRLWLCRALVIAVVHVARRWGTWLCPNYFLAANNLFFGEHSLYAAHELVQMVPLAGMATYRSMRRLNSWTTRYLPNADGPPDRYAERRVDDDSVRRQPLRLFAEIVLDSGIGARLERWEMQRKVPRFRRSANGHGEASFTADCCKGHFDGHGTQTMAAFGDRLRALGLQ